MVKLEGKGYPQNILIHVGYGKAGSTSLQRWFLEHPDILNILRQPVWDTAKRDDVTPRCWVLSSEQLISHFPHAVVGSRFNESHNIKEHQRKAASILAQLWPQAKILIVTRGFRSVIRSVYSQFVKTGGDLRYDEFLTKYMRFFADLYDYNYAIELYQKLFGRESVCVLPYELLKEDPSTFYAVVESVMAVSHLKDIPHWLNKSLTPKELSVYPYISRFAARIALFLPQERGSSFFRAHIKLIRGGFYTVLVKSLSRLFKAVYPVEEEQVLSDVFRGKADLLKAFPVFNDFFNEHYKGMIA